MSQPAGKCPFHFPGLFDPGYVRDPYPLLAQAREQAPIFPLPDGVTESESAHLARFTVRLAAVLATEPTMLLTTTV